MREDKKLYFLQPSSDQAVGTAKLLNEANYGEVIAVLLKGEKLPKVLKKYYTDICIVNDYSVLLEEHRKIVVPFGAQSTEKALSFTDIKLNQVVMKRSALDVYDKELFLRFCHINDFPIPHTFENELEIKEEDFPVFYKQKYEKGGGVRGIAYSYDELPKTDKESLIYQEYIDSKGTYGVAFIANNGLLETQFTHFESESFPESGGSAIKIEAYASERLEELTRRFLSAFNYSGWGLAEFKWCEKRRDFVFMEINAKFWASCEFTFRNEPKFLELLFDTRVSKENINEMFFINRAFSSGFVKGMNCFLNNKISYKVVYPGLTKQIAYKFIPKFLKDFLKKFL